MRIVAGRLGGRRLAALDGLGFGTVEEVRTAEEDLVFSLPRELRRDAAGVRDPRALGGRS